MKMGERNSTDSQGYPRLLSLAVHEFRTPASIVAGYLRMMQSGVGGAMSDSHRKMIAEAEKGCGRLVELIAELSDIGKLDAELLPFAQERFDLFQLISDVASDMHEAQDREVKLLLRGATQGAPVIGDRGRLNKAFSVLFRAVLREQPAATTVIAERRIDGSGNAPRAVILIAREECVQRTYDAQPAPLDELRGGLGLGLPLARRVIERHRGQVWSPAAGDGDDAAAVRAGMIVSIPTQP
jgi:two-component system, cell cycle sensor histidine kinase DivJ